MMKETIMHSVRGYFRDTLAETEDRTDAYKELVSFIEGIISTIRDINYINNMRNNSECKEIIDTLIEYTWKYRHKAEHVKYYR